MLIHLVTISFIHYVIENSPRKIISSASVKEDWNLQQSLKRASSFVMDLIISNSYFKDTVPIVSVVDNINVVDYHDTNGSLVGHSYFVEGSYKDVITMVRRVEKTYHYSDEAVRATLDTLKGWIENNNKSIKGMLVVKSIAATPVDGQSIDVGASFEKSTRDSSVNNQNVSLDKPSSGASMPTHGEEPSYHGTSIPPHGEESSYHGTSMPPHGEESSYHGTSMPPHGEESSYHGTYIPPHGEEMADTPVKEESLYHSTSIPPYSDDDIKQELGERSSPNIYQYMNRPKDMKYTEEMIHPINQKRYISAAEQRRRALHKRPEKKVTWEEIRQRKCIVCSKKQLYFIPSLFNIC